MQAQVLNFKFEEVSEVKSFMDPEWQANEFAAQLLIPEEYFDLPAEELVDKSHNSSNNLQNDGILYPLLQVNSRIIEAFNINKLVLYYELYILFRLTPKNVQSYRIKSKYANFSIKIKQKSAFCNKKPQ